MQKSAAADLTTLSLETSGRSSTSSLFELQTLGSDVWLSVGTNGTRSTKVLLGFSVVVTSHQDGTLALWSNLSQLVKSVNLTTVGLNSSSDGLGHLQGSDLQASWHFQHSVVVCDGTNNNSNDLAGISAIQVLHKSSQGDWSLVLSGLSKSLQDQLVEWRFSLSAQVCVELNEQSQVSVL